MTRRERPTSLAELVARYLGEQEGRSRRAGQALAMRVFAAFERIGKPVIDHAEPVHLRAGVLTVEVNQSAWLTELSFLKPQIITRINQLVGKDAVKELRMRLGNLKPPPQVDPPRTLRAEEKEAIADWVAGIGDPELKEAIRRAAERTLQRGPVPNAYHPGPPGPMPFPKQPEPEPDKMSYGYGDKPIDRWKTKR